VKSVFLFLYTDGKKHGGVLSLSSVSNLWKAVLVSEML